MKKSILERPNLISILILVALLGIAGAYVLVTLDQRPENESFTAMDGYEFPFNFDRLGQVVTLPSELREISGISVWKNPNEVIAIQDEDGELFVVDVTSGEVNRSIKFGKDLDYEGVTRRGDDIFVLEADGDIHYFVYTEDASEYDAKKTETVFSYRNETEGIVYDSLTESLLVVPKSQELDPLNDVDPRRGIYQFDLKEFEMYSQPAYYIDELEVGRIVFGQEKKYPIRPSGIAVDPLTGDIYVISSIGKILVVIDRESQIKHVELLEKNVFSQPEGIAFAPDGTLYISSEGRSGRGVIATLNRLSGGNTQPSNNQ